MKLSAIKESIIKHLNNLSIDDFYADPQLKSVKKVFTELTGLETDEEFKKYLHERFPETRIEVFQHSIKKEIEFLTHELSKAETIIKTDQDEVFKLEKAIGQNQTKLKEIPNQQVKINSDLAEIEIEINQIKPLSIKSLYDKQLNDLEKNKLLILKTLESLPLLFSNLEKEKNELTNELNSKIESIDLKKADFKSIENRIIENQNTLNKLNSEENELFDKEYTALVFLFKILLYQNIEIDNNYIEEKTGKMIKDNYGDYIEEVVDVKSEVLHEVTCNFDELKELIKEYTKKGNTIPNEWRKTLLKIISMPIGGFMGRCYSLSVDYQRNKDNMFFYREKMSLTPVDISAILATKIALKTNYSLRIEANKIALALSGGIMAIITFREKGDIINAYQQEPVEFYTASYNGLNEKQTLYFQKGYADSQIQIEIPNKYYILSKDYVIEIEYTCAPILMNSNSIIKLVPDISSKAKREDEIAEESKRQQNSMDDWDDDYDDDDY